jgi:hypothetical protein
MRFWLRSVWSFVFLTAVLQCKFEPRGDEAVDARTAAQPSSGGRGGGGALATGRAGGTSRDQDGPSATGGAGGAGFSCENSAPCALPGKPCVLGATQCEGPSATCVETPRNQANGSPCGTDGQSVCLDGVCSACRAGLECPVDSPCKSGTIECGTGLPRCLETGNAPNGSSCGQGRVCREGVCAECRAGDGCLPSNPCHEGTLDCAAGAATCKDSGQAKAAGSLCGVNKVCSPLGECVACTSGMPCELGDQACKVGKIECSTGGPICGATGNAQNGKSCGNGRVCREGSCEACADGMPCAPENRCHAGSLSCASGTPVCMDTGTNVRNGTQCGNNLYCSNGTCAACTPGTSCTPNGNTCKTGRTSCETGTSQCQEMADQRDGTSCGNGRACQGGVCVSCGGIGQPCCGSACNGGPRCSGGDVVAPFCDNGTCRERMNDDCDACEECNGNRCEPKRCSANQVCQGGACVCRKSCNGRCIGESECCDCDEERTCQGDGRAVFNVCNSGRCEQRSENCDTTTRCSGQNLVLGRCENGRCNNNVVLEACGQPGCNNTRKACNLCKPNEAKCEDEQLSETLLQCSADGSRQNMFFCSDSSVACENARCCGGPGEPCCTIPGHQACVNTAICPQVSRICP